MPRFKIPGVRRKVASPSSGGGTPTADLLLGFNIADTSLSGQNWIENDARFANGYYSRPSGASLDTSKYDATGWPTGPNSGDTAVSYIFSPPETAGAFDLTFEGGNKASSYSLYACTGTADLSAGTATLTPDAAQPNQVGWGINFVPNTGIPKVLSCKKQGATGTLAPSFLTHVSEASVPGSALRSLKRVGVEHNEGIVVTSTAEAFPSPVLTAANRRTTTSGNWYIEGPPWENDIAMAVAANRCLWRALPWNGSNDYYDAVGDLLAAAAINSGLTTYVEVSNEVWNGGYPVFHQARYEGLSSAIPSISGGSVVIVNGSISGTVLTVNSVTSGGNNITTGMPVLGDPPMILNTFISSLGTGTGGTGTYNLNSAPGNVTNVRIALNCGLQLERFIEKTAAVMDRLTARFVAAGAPTSKLKRVLSWQNDQMDAYATAILNYAPPGKTAVKNHIDVLASAPYLNQSYAANTTHTVDEWISDHIDAIDRDIDLKAKAGYDAATAAGLEYACYEFGPNWFIDDSTTKNAVMADSGQYDLGMHLHARMAAKLPGVVANNFCMPHIQYSNQSFGILDYSGQSPTQRYNAAKDFAAGKRKLLTLSGTMSSVVQGQALGYTLATFKRRTPGSTVSISPSSLAFTDATAQILTVVVADASAFASPGSISWTITETDARDTVGTKTTTGTLTIASDGLGTTHTPADLGTSLKGWWKADTLAGADASSVTSWSDNSGNSRTATASGNAPVVKASGLNSLKTLKFTAASTQNLSVPSAMLSGLTEGAAIVVCKANNDPPLGTSSSGPALGDWGSSGGGDHSPWTDGHWYSVFGSTGRKDISGISASSAFKIVGLRSKSGGWALDINGTNAYTTATNTVGWGGNPRIGYSPASTGYLDGEIAEIIFVDTYMTTRQKEFLEGYVAHKWWGAGALNPLPSGHTYKTTAP